MRYIRVIDDLGNEYITTYEEHCEDVADMQDSGFDFEGCIIKQANTIEELCDEIVIDGDSLISLYSVKSNGKVLWKYKRDNSYAPVTFSLNKTEDVYGAIWTDKGLIYVAKMKGILPNGEIDWELL